MSSSPGGVSYSSNTMFVGDATWDASRNSYLLPNLQGLNFNTMRYNGMGNRFRSDSRYQALIIAHGVLAALAFLFITPLAVFIAKFYHADGPRALRLHVTLQVTSTILLTVVIVLGVLAVGSDRAFTNPHHGIGIAIYVAVLLQAIGGAIIRQTEKRKRRPYQLPVRLMLHKWFGRGIVLLGIAQVALGLTLYGSPLWLFVMYAIVVGVWLTLLFYYSQEMQYDNPHPPQPRPSQRLQQEARYQVPVAQPRGRGQQRMLAYHNDRPERRGRRHSRSRRGHHYLRDAALSAGAAGAYHNWRQSSHDRSNQRYYQRQSQQYPEHMHQPPPDMIQQSPATPHSYQSSFDDKSPITPDGHPWRDRMLGAGAGVAALEGGRSLLHGNRRDSIRHSLEKPPLTPVHGQSYSQGSDSAHRPKSPHVTFATPPHSSNDSSSSLAPADRLYRDQFIAAQRLGSEEGSSVHPRTDGLIGTLAAVTGLTAFRQKMQNRRDLREQERLDDMTRIDQYNAERLHRSYSRRAQRERDEEEQRRQWEPTSTLSTFDGSQADSPRLHHQGAQQQPPSTYNDPSSHQNDPILSPRMPLASHGPDFPGAPPASAAQPGSAPVNAARETPQPLAVNSTFGDDSSIQASPIRLPAPSATAIPLPAPAAATRQPANSAIADQTTTSPQQPSHLMSGALPVAAQPGLAPPAPPSYTQSQTQANDAEGSIYSGSVSLSSVRMTEPPVSVKVRIHNNQRHVTMRKLNEAEIAAERARQTRQMPRATSSAGVQVEDVQRGAGARVPMQGNAPPGAAMPMAMPYSSPVASRTNEYLNQVRNADGYSSPGTETSGSSAFEQNRRRRRAERTSPQMLNTTLSPRGS